MRSYVILDRDKVETINFNEVMEISSDTLRFSVDGDKTFVKFEGDTPDFSGGQNNIHSF